MYRLQSNPTDRINLDQFAYNRGMEDARTVEQGTDATAYGHELVDAALEDAELTDDPEEYRARYVAAYAQGFQAGQERD